MTLLESWGRLQIIKAMPGIALLTVFIKGIASTAPKLGTDKTNPANLFAGLASRK